ncbi:hypothetical protein [Thalassobellus suaedae]|uniref:Uncharacterized protein n=1 Tax=Thalassobellus suaedae TaxID=3074124 RepID=A0ABY9XUF6_9FLAO|nr:hypothetical protein RHP51_01485 [Flavobacteriaceae bacterium HL-DH14]
MVPKEWNVHFKLHASQNTVVEVMLKNGKVDIIEVVPEERRKDIQNLLLFTLDEKINLN